MPNGILPPPPPPPSWWPTWRSNPLFTVLLTLLLLCLLAWLGISGYYKWRQAVDLERTPTARSIMISGTGKATGTPTIATAILGLQTIKPDVPTAQRENTGKMTAFMETLRAVGIASDDVQTTDYSIYPQYRYDEKTGRSEIDGYQVNQSVTVKIRDLTKIGTVLERAGSAGLNQVSGLSFTIDEPETLRAEARKKALTQAKEKADTLAESLGVKLGKVVSFNEFSGTPDSPSSYYGRELGLGGGGGPPPIATGSLDMTIEVQVTYEIE